MSTPARIPGVDMRLRHRGDPAAEEVLTLREWCLELADMLDDWLDGRERWREQQAEQREAAEHRAQTEHLRHRRQQP